jgi:hypothetical protein
VLRRPVESSDRKKWKTRLELANAIFDYIEIFYNRQRRRSSLGYRTPIEHELLSQRTLETAASQPPRPEPERWGGSNCSAGHLVDNPSANTVGANPITRASRS